MADPNLEYIKPSELPELLDITGAQIAPVVLNGLTYRVPLSALKGDTGDQGLQGDAGVSSFTYIAYASDGAGSDFSLNESAALKYRAEIHSAVVLTPLESDFAGADWMKYLGDDGLGSGDMLKATYDPTNKNGDAFDRTKHHGEQPQSSITDLVADLADKQASLGFTPENIANKGQADGYAELDSAGKVPAGQLPSFVDDVLEYADFASLPAVGESGKIYITLDDGKTFRWSGSAYAEISASLALGETIATAYRGDRGKIAYDHSQEDHAPNNAEANAAQVNAAEITAGSEAALRSFSPADIAAFFTKHSIVLIPFSISDTSSDLEAGIGKGHFHMPFTGTLFGVYAGVQTTPSGSTLIFDINKAGSTVLSTKISIDSGEKSSHTAATAPVISSASFAKGDEVTADIDQVGSTTAGKWATIYMMFKVTAL